MKKLTFKDFKPGTYALIKKQSRLTRQDFRFGLSPPMEKYLGKIILISETHGKEELKQYVKTGYFSWNAECFEKIFTKEENPEYYI